MIGIGNQAIAVEFNTDKAALLPARVTNKLAGKDVRFMDSRFVLVIEEGGSLIKLSNRDMRCTSIDRTVENTVSCELMSDQLGVTLRIAYSVSGQTIRLHATVQNTGNKAVHIRDAILLQAMTDSTIKGQVSEHDFSLGDAGTLTSDVLKRVDAHPLFIEDHLFVGIDWPVAENVVQNQTFRCKQFVGETLAPGVSFAFRPLSIGVSTAGALPQAFLDHLKRLRGRETRRASMYFDWLVHASEGLTENEYDKLLDFFALLKEKFGVRFDLFCADDGIFETRWQTTFDLYRKQYESLFPHGFNRMSERMKAMGTECGAWLGPDGFGETAEDEQRRIETIVSLIREHGIGLLKLDVCVSVPLGNDPYRNEHYVRKLERMVAACHEVNPDIIIINHRISTSPYILTMLDSTLWMGAESYPDHYLYNDDKPRLFTRFGAYGRGEPAYYGAYSELLEDHGICFNGFMEGWQEELVVQTFGRALMLSPEIYGTMFLLPDEDYQDLARIMKLAERFRDLLAHTAYDRAAGDFIHCDGKSALLCLINDSWKTVTRDVSINGTIGLHREADAYRIIRHFPFTGGDLPEAVITWGGTAKVKLSPFQACVVEIEPVKGNMAKAAAQVVLSTLPQGRIDRSSIDLGMFEHAAPRPEDTVTAELVRFTVSSDPTEAQVLDRSEPSQYAEVNRCREFFREKLRKECYGISSGAWDGDPTTAWGDSPFWRDSENVWRMDLGALHKVDRIEVTFADIGPGPLIELEKGRVLPRSLLFEVSADAKEWHSAEAVLYYRRQAIDPKTLPQKLIADLVQHPVRYVRMHMRGVLVGDIRIQTRDNGVLRNIPNDSWKANNLLTTRPVQAVFRKSFTVDEVWEGRFAVVVVELPADTKVKLKQEIAAVWVETGDGRKWLVTQASPAFPYNGWEGNANRKGNCWTFRLPLTADMCNLPLTCCLAWFGPIEEMQDVVLPSVKGYLIAVK